jgi:CO/xanthine dehydrogenase FAD-binding subunit
VAESETINPRTLKDAINHAAKGNVRPIAGGTDLLVKLHDIYDKPWPKLLVLDRVKALHKIVNKGGKIILGPLITFTDIERSDLLSKYAPQLVQAASVAGSVQIRNRATIGGNIANGSPAGDLIPPLYVLDAVLELSSKKGKRSVPIVEFFKGPGLTVLRRNELVTAIRIDKSFGYGFFNRLATRKALAISKVSVAANISLKSGKINEVKIALGAVAPTVIRAPETEKFLAGKKPAEDIISDAVKIIRREARPIDDLRSQAEYRREMVGVLLGRGLKSVLLKK